jgi:RNA polymerase sigma-70 factor (ECF subfamily)
LGTFNRVYNVGVTFDLGDPQAFRSAFNDHHRAVYTAAFRIVGDAALAQDVVQDVFLRLWRRPGSFNPERGDLGTYLRLMARSRALDLWRESQVRGRAADRLKVVTGTDEPRNDDHPAVIAERDQDSAEVREALGKLPEAQREAIVLAYWGGLTADQIARRAHVPLGTAKSRIRLGLARLRDEFAVADLTPA